MLVIERFALDSSDLCEDVWRHYYTLLPTWLVTCGGRSTPMQRCTDAVSALRPLGCSILANRAFGAGSPLPSSPRNGCCGESCSRRAQQVKRGASSLLPAKMSLHFFDLVYQRAGAKAQLVVFGSLTPEEARREYGLAHVAEQRFLQKRAVGFPLTGEAARRETWATIRFISDRL